MLRLKKIWEGKKKLSELTKFITSPLFVIGLIFVMKAMMRSFFGKHKIFNSIVSHNTINMMNNFLRCKRPSKLFFHYKTMFENIIFIRRMIISSYCYVTIQHYFSTFPISISFTFIKCRKFITALDRTHMPFMIAHLAWLAIYRFFTYITMELHHNNILYRRINLCQ